MADPWAIDTSSSAPAYSAQEMRLTTVAPFLVGAGASLGVRSGVRLSGSGTDLLVQAQSSPNMTIKVNPGVVAVQGSISSTQGPYTWALESVTNVTIAAAHASLARTDLIAVRIRDANVDTSGARDGDVVRIAGTAGGGVPSLPTDATYLELARVGVRSTGSGGGTIITSDITDRRVYTAALGGVITCTSSTRPAASSCPPGQPMYETDTGLSYRNNTAASKWLRDPVTVIETGSTGVSSSTLINAPNLKFSGEANCTYWFEAELHYTALSTPKFDGAITFPTGVTVQMGRWLRASADNSFYTDALNAVSSGSRNSGGLAANAFSSMRLNGTAAFGGTAGTFQVQFSQTVTDGANASFLLAGSYLNYRQIS